MSVRVGLVGSSGWSEFMYLQNLQGFEHGEIVAIAARNEVRLQSLGEKYGIEHLFTDVQSLIDSGTIDAIIVATPDEHHHPITMAAIKAGIHVMCEKPLAMNAVDAKEMLDAVEAAGLIHNVMFTWRNLPLHKKVKELIDEGAIGNVYHFDIRFFMDYACSNAYQWRLDVKHGTGALGDLGVHDIDLARWMVGEISSVSASLKNSVDRVDQAGNPVEPTNDTCILMVEFERGGHGVISDSMVIAQGGREMEQRVLVSGSNGSIEGTLYMDGPNQGMKLWVTRGTLHAEEIDLGVEMWSNLGTQTVGVREFVENVALGRQQGPDFRDGFAAQVVVDAAFESHRAGRRIAL
jgi:predicted dehydrogenase